MKVSIRKGLSTTWNLVSGKTLEDIVYKASNSDNFFPQLRKTIRTSGKILTLLAIPYATLLSTDLIANYTSPKIRTQEELKKVTKREALKLGMNPEEITCKLQKYTAGHVKGINPPKKFKIVLGGMLANEKMVKHELYHAYDKHLENNSELLY